MPNPRIKFPIFLKLILLITVFIVLINIIEGLIIRYSFDRRPGEDVPKYVNVVKNYIFNEISIPPDTLKAARFTKDLNFNIRIHYNGMIWTNDNSLPDINVFKDIRTEGKDSLVRLNGHPYFIRNFQGGYIIASPDFPRNFINTEKLIIANVIALSLLTALLYLTLRWMFGPIRKLTSGVEFIGRGNYGHKILLNRKDELGKLAEAINEMSANIKDAVHSKEKLLIDVSHELRSPLTRIKLASEFIDDSEMKSRIQDDVKELEAMISELLDTYRLDNEHGKIVKKDVDLVKLLNEVIEKYKFLNSNINFKTSLKEKVISIDEEKIKTAISNIIDNALKYSNGKTVDISLYETDRTARLSIKDHGIGIPENEIKFIFEPFYRIDKSRGRKTGGYGLGLSLVKRILDEHNAKIEVTGKPGETEFIIIF
jgi:signal transduction histidine kinase